MNLSEDYVERVYAGVLGKLIGVYVGRPFEGWSYEQITAQLGDIDGYVNDKVARLAQAQGIVNHAPLVITDDDVTGTFTFIRALADFGAAVTPQQIGDIWLNHVVERRSTFWWGGFGNSSEHTAYLRLKQGVDAPASGSIALNGAVTAEQIGAQIFIDGWGLVSPGDPERAVDLARRSASVSHDGEAIYGAQVVAALVAAAFVEDEVGKLLETAVSLIPRDSTIYRLIADLRHWHAAEPDWRQTRARLDAAYGYHKYPGNVHIVPNHGLIILGLLYGRDFQEVMRIVNTSGWDTDCNAANAGCIWGVKNGLAGLEAGGDWRGPVADRLFLPGGDGGRAITDAVRESYELVNLGRRLADLPPLHPKNGARFHFSLPGSVQGWQGDGATVANVLLPDGTRRLAVQFGDQPGQAFTPTFYQPEELQPGMMQIFRNGSLSGYEPVGSPSLYAGQTVRLRLTNAGEGETAVSLFIKTLASEIVETSEVFLSGETREWAWVVPSTGGWPITAVGLAGQNGLLHLDWLTWAGTAVGPLHPPADQPRHWQRAWVNGMDDWGAFFHEPFRLSHFQGRGVLACGAAEWGDYAVGATMGVNQAAAAGIAARVQGMRRYVALLLTPGKLQLVQRFDRMETVLAEVDFHWQNGRSYSLRLEAAGRTLRGWVDGDLLLTTNEVNGRLLNGGAGFILEEGHLVGKSLDIERIGS
ncbi:MAG: ADP-ribosylglycohydrolase family protein [Ardenticatenaceae bacterium]|nr:ADP-ribosylglycohydrolase family protein [Ardenticatenaceae bacterium]